MATVDLGEFAFERGGRLSNLTVAYETYGEYDGGNAVLVCHALTGSQHVRAPDGDRGQGRGWWHDVVGPGNPIDTDRYFVVCANVPGSCYGTDGPATEAPDGEPWGPDFPAVTVADWTRSQRRLLETIGVDGLHAVVGGSVGGMNALDWARRFPGFVERVAAVATAPRLDPQLLAIDAVRRNAIRADSNYGDGHYYDRHHPDRGLALARQLGHVAYLSKASMQRKFGRRTADRDPESPFPDGTEDFPTRAVESYLDYQAGEFVARFDANSYLWLLRAMDHFDLAAGYASDADALADFDGDALVLSFSADWHFTPAQASRLADAFREAGARTTHREVDSDHGHDAFLVEPASVGPPLRALLGDDTTDLDRPPADRRAAGRTDCTAATDHSQTHCTQ
jgi:homoserine O-acetyltransferase